MVDGGLDLFGVPLGEDVAQQVGDVRADRGERLVAFRREVDRARSAVAVVDGATDEAGVDDRADLPARDREVDAQVVCDAADLRGAVDVEVAQDADARAGDVDAPCEEAADLALCTTERLDRPDEVGDRRVGGGRSLVAAVVLWSMGLLGCVPSILRTCLPNASVAVRESAHTEPPHPQGGSVWRR